MSKSALIKIWVALLAMLGVSIAIGEMQSALIGTILIFMVAAAKAFLVLRYYMGLKNEPKYITAAMVSALLFMIMLFFVLTPDIIHVYGKP